MPSFLREIFEEFFEYETPMFVHIKHLTVGIINRVIQLLIIVYFIGFAIIYKKGYQEFDYVRSAVTTKVMGVAFDDSTPLGPLTRDVADNVIPPRETNAFFVVTSTISTIMQTQKTCPESPRIRDALCQNNDQCEHRKSIVPLYGNGPLTGNCVPSSITGYEKQNVCEIYGWCPVEDDNETKRALFPASENFTVFIKNSVAFPEFGVAKRNIMEWYNNSTELSRCMWKRDDPKDKYCPIFRLGDITEATGVTFSSILKRGGLFAIIITWNCNLDYDLDDCLPEYSFSRLDSGNYSLALSCTFRYSDNFVIKDKSGKPRIYRNLHKVSGVHFVVEVRGEAGKFSILPLLVNVGSGMGLLGIASVLCDIIVLYFLKARKFYKQKKYLLVTTERPDNEKKESRDEHEPKESKPESIGGSTSELVQKGDGGP